MLSIALMHVVTYNVILTFLHVKLPMQNVTPSAKRKASELDTQMCKDPRIYRHLWIRYVV